MGKEQSNEITVKIKCELKELYEILTQKGFKVAERFTLDDTYFMPKTLKIKEIGIRESLARAIIVRKVKRYNPNKESNEMIYKTKHFDEFGNIISQEKVQCDVLNIEDAKNLLKAIGYEEIMNIKESDIVYEKQGFELAIKDIENGDKLMEVEETEELDTTEKLIQRLNELKIPIYTDDYFVKKAEIELEKILKTNN